MPHLPSFHFPGVAERLAIARPERFAETGARNVDMAKVHGNSSANANNHANQKTPCQQGGGHSVFRARLCGLSQPTRLVQRRFRAAGESMYPDRSAESGTVQMFGLTSDVYGEDTLYVGLRCDL